MAQLPDWFIGSPTPEPPEVVAAQRPTRQSERLRVKRERRSPSPSVRSREDTAWAVDSSANATSAPSEVLHDIVDCLPNKASGAKATRPHKRAILKRRRRESSEYEEEDVKPLKRKSGKGLKREKIEDGLEGAPEASQPRLRAGKSAWKASRVSDAMLTVLDLGVFQPVVSPRAAPAARPPAPRKKATMVSTKRSQQSSVLRESSAVQPHTAAEPPNRPLSPRVPGIPSSKFCQVLRLLCDMRQAVSGQPPVKRAPPPMRPPVWAESRQELCETLPYYRAYQAGLHMYRKVAYGYLLEGFGAPRDVWADKGRVVISHGGGQCIRPPTATNDKVPAVLQADQSPTDARVATLLEAARRKTPIVLIAGEGYELLPWKLDCMYVVLGWYWTSATWVEAEPVASGVAGPPDRDWFQRVKIRFDWIESQGTPWWLADSPSLTSGVAASGSPPSPAPAVSGAPANALLKERLRVEYLLNPACGTERAEDQDVNSAVRTAHGLLTPPDTPPQPAFGALAVSIVSRGSEASSTDDRTDVPVLGAENDTSDIYGRRVSVCSTCGKESLRVYAEGWTCLQPECPAFWLLASAVGLLPIPPGFRLRYSPDFLRQVSTPPHAIPPYSVCPPLPSEDHFETHMGDRRLQTGWVCECGRANCRYRWDCWECRACGKQTHQLTMANFVPVAAMPRRHAFLGDARVAEQMRTEMRRMTTPGATVMHYHLPRGGQVYHVIPDVVDDADEFFEQYQEEALYSPRCLFERRPLKSIHTVKGATLAQHFALNSGAAYKYAVDTVSVPFDESPECVLSALNHIRHYTSAVLGEPATFNEVLSVLYREGQKMSWHDDGEEGLGPVVASLSLGSTATMSFRPKGPRKDTSRRFEQGGSIKPNRQHAEASLSLTLSHGDVVIMTGYELQRRYEHRVLPDGLRVAATARYISPSHGGNVDAR